LAKTKFTGVREMRGKIQIYWWHEGAQYHKSLDLSYTAANVKKAYKICQEHIEAQIVGKTETEYKNPTFGSLAQVFLDTHSLSKETHRKYKMMLNRYWTWAFKMPIGSITKTHVLQNFKNWDHSLKHKKACISVASGVFELAMDDAQIDCHVNPTLSITKRMKMPAKNCDPFSAEERDAILNHLKEEARLFYLIRFYCGLRPGEAIALTWKDYVKGNFFIAKTKSKHELKNTTKTLRDRVVPVHPIVQEALKMQPRQLHDDHIVISRHKRGYAAYEPLTKSFNLAMTKLQIRYRSPYNARHTCATMMLESGMEPAYCAHVLGHSLEEFLRTYARWIDADRSAAQAKIWATIK